MESFKLPSIPTPKPNDPEDVSWALSTAEAMWGRGDHAEAIKWIRRGAEAASEAEADDRALELAKAAADLASMVVRMSQPDPSSARPQLPHPGSPQTAGSSRAPPPAAGREVGVASAPVTTRSVPPPSVAPPRGLSPSAAPPRIGTVAPPATGTSATDKSPRPLQAARGPERTLSTAKGVLSPRIETKRRRSSGNLEDEARSPSAPREEARKTHADPPEQDAVAAREAQKARRDPATSEDAGTQADVERERDSPVTTDELGRTSEHDSMAAALSSMAMSLPTADDGRAKKKTRRSRTNEGRAPADARRGTVTDEWDAQPTQSLSRAELDSITNEHSQPRMLAARSKELLPPLETSPRGQLPDPLDSEPGSQMAATQAMRVLLWRDAEGVHVAAAGTVVSAITVDAILVALSPSVDLSAWLDPERGLMSGRASPVPSRPASEASKPVEASEASGASGASGRSERAQRNEEARGKLPK